LARIEQRSNASLSTSARASLVLTLVLQLRGDLDAARARAEVCAALCRKFGMSHHLQGATLLAGASVRLEPGIAHPSLLAMREAWQISSVTGSELSGALACLLAQQNAAAGLFEDAASVLSAALHRAERGEEGLWAPELWRTLGRLIEQTGVVSPGFVVGHRTASSALPSDPARAAELCFRRALDQARGMQAKLLELRAATSLARLWRKNGRASAAHDLLSQACAGISEGFATRDVREAIELREELTKPSPKSSSLQWR
jgi:hypothetical protein